MVDIVIATRNPKKLRELKALLTLPGVRWRSLADFPHGRDVRERGRTFAQNAITKARAVAKATGRWAIADDSGLEVDVLDGAPGVYSARFAGRHGDDDANNAKLLKLLAHIPPARRSARFRCVIALASPRQLLAVTEGRWEGRIAFAPKGRGGFGYDPVFLVPRRGQTAAQLPPALKHRLSHRGKAVRRMQRQLRRLVQETGC